MVSAARHFLRLAHWPGGREPLAILTLKTSNFLIAAKQFIARILEQKKEKKNKINALEYIMHICSVQPRFSALIFIRNSAMESVFASCGYMRLSWKGGSTVAAAAT